MSEEQEQQERRKRSEKLLAWLKCRWGNLCGRAKEWFSVDRQKPDDEGLFDYLKGRWGKLPIQIKLWLFTGIFAALIFIWFFINPAFAQFIGYLIGGGLLALQILASNRRATATEETAKAMQKTAQSTEKGNTDERFKNAIEHLGHQSASIRLGGIYALDHIAQEVEEYRKRVFEILCAHIRETTTHEAYEPRIIKSDRGKSEQEKPAIEIQSILNLLFMQTSGREIYEQFAANLENANLAGASLVIANLQNANLENIKLDHANLLFTLQRANLQLANLRGTNLQKADLQEACLQEADLQKANLLGAELLGADLRYANLQEAENLKVEQLLKAKTLYRAKLPKGMRQEIRQKKPRTSSKTDR